MTLNLRFVALAAICLYPILWIWQGLDVTDTGYALANSYFAIRYPSGLEHASIFSIANWLSAAIFTPLPHNVITTRMATALVVSLVALGSLKALDLLRSTTAAVLITLLCLLVQVTHRPSALMTLNYDYWGGILGIVALLGAAYHGNRQRFWLVAGFFAALHLGSRFPSGLAIYAAAGIIFIGVHRWNWRGIGIVLVGSTIAIFAAACFSLAIGATQGWLTAMSDVLVVALGSTQVHNGSAMLGDFLQSLRLPVLTAGVIFTGHMLLRKMAMSELWLLLPLALLGIYGIHDPNRYTLASLGASAAVSYLYWQPTTQTLRKFNRFFLITAAVALAIISPFGSSAVLYKWTFGAWLLVPIAATTILQITGDNHRPFLGYVVLIFFFVVPGVATRFNLVHQEPSRHLLTTQYSIDPLEGIKSEATRVEAVESAHNAIMGNVDPDEPILILGGMPLLHYTTQRRPFLNSPWPDLQDPEDLAKFWNQRTSASGKPRWILRPKFETSSAEWPANAKPRTHPRVTANDEYMQEQLLRYTLHWQDKWSELYRLPNYTSGIQ